MRPKAILITFLLSVFFFTFSSHIFSQVSQGGIPISLEQNVRPDYETLSFLPPDMESIMLEDQQDAEMGYPERMAVSVIIDRSPANSGTWEYLPDGSRLWRLRLQVPGALALGVYFDEFQLEEGSSLFLYNEDRTQIIGAFTAMNNHSSGYFATQFIQGDAVTIELHVEAGDQENPAMNISEIAYAYRHISFEETSSGRGGSWACMINVACDEGDGWESQSSGVARISIKIGWSYYWCSGSLINNTNNDRTPYFLTAAHCGEGSTATDRNQWIFYFNYQASTCVGNWGPSNNTVSGCSLKANDLSYADAGSDFYLVQLNTTPPASYNVFYNGWNRTNVPGQSGVCIHHPAGDIKKISTYLNPMISSTWWNGLPSHWRVLWSSTQNGLSIMQGGSSGSPIFDQDGLIMGDLTGGYASNSCTSPSPAWFGKIWYSWDQNGTTSSTRLKDWLDPTNTGIEKLPGVSWQILPPSTDFIADTTILFQADTVYFTDLTTGNPASSWEWVFEGGTPPTSSEKDPMVIYMSPGTFDVSLTVTNADGTDTETKNDYISVLQVQPPDADFAADQVEITEGESINFTDLSANYPDSWAWAFSGGYPDTSTLQNPENIIYYDPGVFDVTLISSNIGGSDTEVKAGYITVNAGIIPTTDFMADNTEIMVGDTVNFTDLSTGDPTQWIWTFYGGDPGNSTAQHPSGIVYPQEGTYDVRLVSRNSFGSNALTKAAYIVVGQVSVSDLNNGGGWVIYPNPTRDLLHVKLGNTNVTGSIITVHDILGNELEVFSAEPAGNSFTISMAGWGPGLYLLRWQTAGKSLTKKVLVR